MKVKIFEERLTLLILGFLDPCSTVGGWAQSAPSLPKLANIKDVRKKHGTMVYSNKINTIGYVFHFYYIHDVTISKSEHPKKLSLKKLSASKIRNIDLAKQGLGVNFREKLGPAICDGKVTLYMFNVH